MKIKMDWLLLALAAMFLFSISNTLLKMGSDKFNIVKTIEPLYPAIVAALVVLILGILYLIYIAKVKLPPEFTLIVLGIIVCATIGFVLFLYSLQKGKIAEVTAVLSLSTIVVALISAKVLAIDFTIKEVLAMLMAVASIMLFVL
ncbi:MAG: EamA family transporter [Candidatus Micrarchaeota archaeon]